MAPDDKQFSIEEESASRMPAEPRLQGYFVHVPAQPNEERFNLRRMYEDLRHYWKTIVLAVMLPVVVVAVVVTLLPPVYRSEVLMAPAVAESGQGGLATLSPQAQGLAMMSGVVTNAGSDKNQAIAILESRSFTEQFILDQDLMPVLFANKWDAANNEWDVDSEDDIPTMADAYKKFDEDIRTVNDDISKNLVTLRIEWTDRELAAKWANMLVDRVNDDVRARDIAEAERSIGFLNEEIGKNSIVELRQGLFSLLEQQVEKIMIANVRRGYAFKVLDPAVPADADEYVFPKKLIFIPGSVIFGLFLAVIAVAVRVAWNNSARA